MILLKGFFIFVMLSFGVIVFTIIRYLFFLVPLRKIKFNMATGEIETELSKKKALTIAKKAIIDTCESEKAEIEMDDEDLGIVQAHDNAFIYSDRRSENALNEVVLITIKYEDKKFKVKVEAKQMSGNSGEHINGHQKFTKKHKAIFENYPQNRLNKIVSVIKSLC